MRITRRSATVGLLAAAAGALGLRKGGPPPEATGPPPTEGPGATAPHGTICEEGDGKWNTEWVCRDLNGRELSREPWDGRRFLTTEDFPERCATARMETTVSGADIGIIRVRAS